MCRVGTTVTWCLKESVKCLFFWSQLSLHVLGEAEKCGDDGSPKDLVETFLQVVSTFVIILLAISGILDSTLHWFQAVEQKRVGWLEV